MDFELSPIFIPEDLSNLKLPTPELVTFYQSLDNRVLWLDDEIGDQLLEFSKYIIIWKMIERRFLSKTESQLRF